VVHRDVKPDNILLQTVGDHADARLTDFGIARVVDAAGLTTPHAIIGTPHYMAPEVISGAEAEPAADVYAVGMVLYELLTGRVPWTGEPIAVLRHHLDNVVGRPPGIADAAWSLIASCLDKDPRQRPESGELAPMLRDLARVTAGDPALPAPLVADPPAVFSPAGPATPPRRVATPRRRPPNRPRSWVWGRSAAVVALVLGGFSATGVVWKWRDTAGGGSAAAITGTGQAPPAQRLGAGPSAGAGADVVAPSLPGTPPRVPSRAARPRGSAPESGGVTPSRAVPSAPVKVGASAGPGRVDTEVAFGPYQCGDELSWDIGHPVLARPCHAIGGEIRVVGHMEAGPGVQADISLTVLDAGTGEVAAGPYTCEGRMFTDFALKHTCGPVDLKAPRGHRYVVEESWVYTGRSLLPGGRARGREFTW
jgi:serine/threonine-protein kinase